jgi:rubrerythrin
MAKNFKDLSEREILALAISLEEEHGRIFGDFVDGLSETYPATAKMFEAMQAEESEHRRALIDLYRQRFGEHIPLIRRHDVKGFITHRPVWLVRPLGINVVRKQAEIMELETRQFYEKAQERVTDASTRKLLGDLAEIERQHQAAAKSLERTLTTNVREQEEAASRRLFVLQIVQPGLAGLMDGSVSTLAPLFAAAFATHTKPRRISGGPGGLGGRGYLHGLRRSALRRWIADRPRASLGARPGLRADDQCRRHRTYAAVSASELSHCVYGRGRRGGGGVGSISYIRHRYMDSPLLAATLQVVLGGVLVFLAWDRGPKKRSEILSRPALAWG